MSDVDNIGTNENGGDTADAKGFGFIDLFRPQSGSVPAKAKDMRPPNSYHYRVDYPNLGKCIIINNRNFNRDTGLDERFGTDVDAEKVQKVFKELGFSISVHTNRTVSQMMDVLTKASKEDHSQSAMFVCVLLSHGDEGVIYGVDGCLQLKELTRLFRGNQCTSLVGKPKLFFIQACRGKQLDPGIETDSCAESEGTYRIPVEADFLYAYSTAPGYFSWRNKRNGSWFISSLCEMLEKHGTELEVMQLLTRVNCKVALEFHSSTIELEYNGMKQIPCIMSTLTKELYFPK